MDISFVQSPLNALSDLVQIRRNQATRSSKKLERCVCVCVCTHSSNGEVRKGLLGLLRERVVYSSKVCVRECMRVCMCVRVCVLEEDSQKTSGCSRF